VVEAAIESCTGAANLAEELVSQAGWSFAWRALRYSEGVRNSPGQAHERGIVRSAASSSSTPASIRSGAGGTPIVLNGRGKVRDNAMSI
jgi:hypothetical protein